MGITDQHIAPWEVPAEAPIRPAFGTKEWWAEQPELATAILILWRERAPATFGAYLAEVMTGTKPGGRRA